MTEAKKTPARATTKRVARPEAKNPVEALRTAVELAREAGLQVKAVVTRTEEGASVTELL